MIILRNLSNLSSDDSLVRAVEEKIIAQCNNNSPHKGILAMVNVTFLGTNKSTSNIISEDSRMNYSSTRNRTTAKKNIQYRFDHLRFDSCRLDASAMLVLEQSLPVFFGTDQSLKKLTIENSICNDKFVDCVCSLLQHYSHSLQVLELNKVENIKDGCLSSSLLKALERCTNLVDLKLKKCGLEAENLAIIARSLPKLSKLDVSRNNLDDKSLVVLIDHGISYHPSLIGLILSENPLGDDGAVVLSKFLSSSKCYKLKYLSLVECEFWDDGCDYIARNLALFDTLQLLVVDHSWMEHLDTVAESLQEENMTLETFVMLGYGNEKIQKIKAWEKIQFYLRLNRAKRKSLLIANYASSTFALSSVLEKKDADLLFYLLQCRPEILNGANFKP